MEPFSVSSSESQTRFERLRKARMLFEGIRSPLFSFERDFTKIYPSIVQTILLPVKFLLFDAIDNKFFFFSFKNKDEVHFRTRNFSLSGCSFELIGIIIVFHIAVQIACEVKNSKKD